MKKFIYALIGVVIIIGLTSIYCTNKGEEKVTLKIGAPLALSGSAAAWGEEEKRGILLALEGHNGVELYFQDTNTDTNKTLSAGQKLISLDKVDLLIGPTWLDGFLGFLDIIGRNKIVTITPSAVAPILSDTGKSENVFSTWYRTDTQVEVILEEMKKRGDRRLGVFTVNDSFNTYMVRNLKEIAGVYNIEIVYESVSDINETSYEIPLLKARDSNVDAILFWFYGESETIPFLKQRSDLGMVDVTLYSTEWINSMVEDKRNETISKNIIISQPIQNQEFRELYFERFGAYPSFSASNAYDALNILVDTYNAVGKDPEKMRDYLHSNTFDTVTFGKIKFDEINGVEAEAAFEFNVK